MLTTEQRQRFVKVKTLHSGAGANGLKDACVMQAVTWVYKNGEGNFTDAPDCTPTTLRAFAIRLNDAKWPTNAERTKALRPLIPLLVGADGSREAETKRRYFFADFAVREAAPYWFDVIFKLTKKDLYKEHAAKMRAVAPVVDKKTAQEARAVARTAYAAAYAADAAAAAAYAAYAAAAADAAAYAAAYAADDAAAAAYAAYAAAYAAAAADAAAYAAYAAAAADDAAYAAAYAAAAADAAAALSKFRLPILKRAAKVLAEACRITAEKD